MTPQDILDALAACPAATVQSLRAATDGSAIVTALRVAVTEDARELLCDILGFRHECDAVDPLVECLTDVSSGVRSSAADALAKIGDSRAGPALLARILAPEPDPGVYRMLVAAVGAVGHRESISSLIPMLGSDDPSLRGNAAWSLGALGAREALPALADALRSEDSPYSIARVHEAIARIQSSTS